MAITETILIFAPLPVVFDHVEQPEKQKLWMSGLLSNEPTSPGPQGVGSTFHMRIQEGKSVGDYDGEVLAHDRPRLLEIRFWGGGLPAGSKIRVEYRFTQAASGQTRLDYVCTLELAKRGLFAWFLQLMVGLFGRGKLRAYLRELKKHSEAEAVNSAKA